MHNQPINRREFLKLGSLALGSLALRPWNSGLLALPDFPESERLGRVGWYSVDVKQRPDHDSDTLAVLYEDAVVPWLRETVGYRPFRNNQRYVETPQGYIWSGDLIPVRNEVNTPVTVLPQSGDEAGMWVEVTVPYVDTFMDNPPPRSNFFQYRVENGMPLRLYSSQILWVDKVRINDDGAIQYRVNERYGNPGDMLWAPGEALRPITPEELTPISPQVVTNESLYVNYGTNRSYPVTNEIRRCSSAESPLEKRKMQRQPPGLPAQVSRSGASCTPCICPGEQMLKAGICRALAGRRFSTGMGWRFILLFGITTSGNPCLTGV